jgi:DNA-binding CsgD family transcriptional regulator
MGSEPLSSFGGDAAAAHSPRGQAVSARQGAVAESVAGAAVFRRLSTHGLTARECDVLFWIGEGKRDAEIAILLGCARRTVNKHVQNILRKVDAPNRLAAAHLAREWLDLPRAGAGSVADPALPPEERAPQAFGSAGEPRFHLLIGLRLTRRQCEVLHWIAQGSRDAEIARRIGLGRKSVNKMVSGILRKLHAENRATAVSIALRWLQQQEPPRQPPFPEA